MISDGTLKSPRGSPLRVNQPPYIDCDISEAMFRRKKRSLQKVYSGRVGERPISSASSEPVTAALILSLMSKISRCPGTPAPHGRNFRKENLVIIHFR